MGAVLSFLMARTEIAADKEPYTIGNRLLILSLSLLSFVFVIIMLVRAWIKQIHATGYWDSPVVKDKAITIEHKSANGVKRNPSTAKN